MSQAVKGRCAGCGKVGPVRAIEHHTLSCPEFLKKYRESPSEALTPSVEFVRWSEAQASIETEIARQEAKEARARAYKQQGRAKVEAQLERWKGGHMPPGVPVPPPPQSRLENSGSLAGQVAAGWGSVQREADTES